MCFDVSIPIRLTCSTDGLLCLRSATTSVWHARCRQGPSTPAARGEAANDKNLRQARLTSHKLKGGRLTRRSSEGLPDRSPDRSSDAVEQSYRRAAAPPFRERTRRTEMGNLAE